MSKKYLPLFQIVKDFFVNQTLIRKFLIARQIHHQKGSLILVKMNYVTLIERLREKIRKLFKDCSKFTQETF